MFLTKETSVSHERLPNHTEKMALLVKAVRAAMGLSQEAFAQMVGISRPTLQRFEQKDSAAIRSDKLDSMLRKLDELGVSYEESPAGLKIIFSEKALREALRNHQAPKRPSGHKGTAGRK